MEVIALTGRSNIGKSETINIVYQLLLFNGFTQVAGHYRPLGNPIQKDFLDILEKNNLKIGIVSMGDYATGAESVKNLLLSLEIAGCVKAICACTNIKVKTVTAVKAYIKHSFINKSIEANNSLRRIVNGNDANTIYNLV